MKWVVPVACLVFWVPVTVVADDSIRALLGQDLWKIRIQGQRGVLIRDGKGPERLVPGRVVVTGTTTAIVVNGVRMRSKAVTFRGRDGRSGTLTVTASVHRERRAASPTSIHKGSTMEPLHDTVVAGSLEALHRPAGILLVNDVPLEEYVKGVVPAEMSAAWHPEALKAQAVAARTYAVYQQLMNAGREYDVVAGTQDQVYRGRHGVDQRVEEAVESTRGLVVTYQDAPILAAFSSTAAGATEDAFYVWAKDLPYLKGVDCPFDAASPYYQWRVAVPVEVLEQSFRKEGLQVGTIATLTPYQYSPSGRIDKIRILHSEGELVLRGQDFRRVVGYSVIPSTQFEVETLGREAVISGRGSGHAVGLCQWGAKELAEHGYPFDTILRYYFPGTELKSIRSIPALAPSR